tara:strand:+ start:137 stop:760 length:624 start_codon:yes stop_codon:yes gene_type:complete
MLKISDLTIEKLRAGEVLKELPEFYELKEIIEDNDWHANDTVFNHTLTTLEKLEFLLEKTKPEIKSHLNQIITQNTRKQLLFLSTILHDLGKKETKTSRNNMVVFPHHEEVGAQKIKNILDRFDLSEPEKKIITNIVKHHGDIHWILSPTNDKLEEQFEEFKRKFSDIFLELILLGMADTLGGQLQDKHPNEFDFRINFYQKIIDNH